MIRHTLKQLNHQHAASRRRVRALTAGQAVLAFCLECIVAALLVALFSVVGAAILSLSGCATATVTVTKPDGTSVSVTGFSILKDHGLEGFTLERNGDALKVGASGYSSQSRIDLLIKLLEAAR